GSPACQAPSSTDQISCLVQASPCSLGYGSFSAVNGGTIGVNVNNVPPSNQCAQNLLTLRASNPATYKMTGCLLLNAVKVFESIDPVLNPRESNDKRNEHKLAQCFGLDDDGPAGPHGSAAAFASTFPFDFVPLGMAPLCDDVAQNVCGQP